MQPADCFAWILSGVFVIAWLLPLLLIWHYHRYRVPNRLAEVTESFMRKHCHDRLPAQHYVHLFIVPDCKAADAEDEGKLRACIERQFNRHHSAERYIQAGIVLAVTSGFALFTLWAWTASCFEMRRFLSPEAAAALAGAYVWSLYEIQSRRLSNDLTPIELFWTDLRYLSAIPIALCLGELFGTGSHPGIAFALVALPLNDIRRLIRKKTLEKAGLKASGATVDADGLLVNVIKGIDLDAITRLEELQIRTYTSLAYADPIKLMAKTGYPLRLIVQWMDHALLAIYAPTLKHKLVTGGLPCALDVKEFFVAHFAQESGDGQSCTPRVYKDCPAVNHLSSHVGLDPSLLNEIFQRVWSDPHVVFLDTLWYTGYPKGGMRKLPDCPHH